MYKLIILKGSKRGRAFRLQEGSNTIGRSEGVSIVIKSDEISKRHCEISIQGGSVHVSDLGSSNGIFINGVKTKTAKILPGDRIGVGDVILELRKESKSNPKQNTSISKMLVPPLPKLVSELPPEPKTMSEKAVWAFEKFIMPFFYQWNTKQDWKWIVSSLAAAFLVLNLFLSVFPMISTNQETVMEQSAKRARLLANQIVTFNAQAIAENAETKTHVEFAEKDESVRFAGIVDLENRIIAPANQMNRYLAAGEESTYVKKMAEAFNRGREQGSTKAVTGSTLVAVEPIKVYDSRSGKNIVVAMSVVAMDYELSILNIGKMGLVFAQVLIATALLAGLVFWIMYRLVLKPLEILNEDVDKILKGELDRVALDFKRSELTQLWNGLNTAFQRMGSGGSLLSNEKALVSQDIVELASSLGGQMNVGMLVLDGQKKVQFLNGPFEEMSGVRFLDTQGQTLQSSGRDQAFAALIEDMSDRASSSLGSPAEDRFEFSGIPYKVWVKAVSGQFVVTVQRESEALAA